MRRIDADKNGMHDAGIGTWQCRTCTKKRQLEAGPSQGTPQPPARKPCLVRPSTSQLPPQKAAPLPSETPISVDDDDDDIIMLDEPPTAFAAQPKAKSLSVQPPQSSEPARRPGPESYKPPIDDAVCAIVLYSLCGSLNVMCEQSVTKSGGESTQANTSAAGIVRVRASRCASLYVCLLIHALSPRNRPLGARLVIRPFRLANAMSSKSRRHPHAVHPSSIILQPHLHQMYRNRRRHLSNQPAPCPPLHLPQ